MEGVLAPIMRRDEAFGVLNLAFDKSMTVIGVGIFVHCIGLEG
jgi:hypothetical protein